MITLKLMCAYYNNSRRMALVLRKICEQQNAWVFPVKGTLMQTANGLKCMGDVQEYVTLSSAKIPYLFTNNPKMAAYDKSEISAADVGISDSNEGDIKECTVDCQPDNAYIQILLLCLDKFAMSGNPFTVECSIDGASMTIEAKQEAGVTCQVKSPKGDLVTRDAMPFLSGCKCIKSFTYDIITPTSYRSITVKKGQLELLKELSHYLNCGIVLTKIDGEGLARQSVITVHGCAEFIPNKTESVGLYPEGRFVKVPYTKYKVDLDCAVSTIDAGLDTILRAKNMASVF